ncbi:acylase [Aggregicoccus sp. 17bor-14]|uniref:penicillin acylase family protein n=1 Tax=Myxococcaceae TaxID=31 RepID=UPI00129C5CA6|nr:MULTISPECIES: penicillin acylase family protein [Myxococcaceae]MBF5046596.1 penicillin acylase family protein [Simulacricoccus sp. 17bor-14]MRI92307.1 acylase [Aggregicoccus sp. 17bor-14]
MRSRDAKAEVPQSWRDRSRRAGGALLALTLALAGCSDDKKGDETPPPSTTPRYSAKLTRTSHGIPHITADSWGNAGFGQGYAFAEDHACILADQVLKVRGERARFMGAGELNANVASDFVHLALDLRSRATAALQAQPPEVHDFIDGYIAGYNQYLKDVGGPPGVKGWCAGKEWVRAIDEQDLMAHLLSLSLAASSTQFVSNIAAAVPPGTSGAGVRIDPVPLSSEKALASNGWAIGAERSASGKGMVVGNPHFPWEGELRLWESHLTIPGQLNIYGVSLMGTPGVLIGFNEHVAWTHTFSSGQRFSIYALPLIPGHPTQYLYNGAPRDMVKKTFGITVLQPDGSQLPLSRDIWFSHYGPIISPFGVEWNSSFALTYRDANLDNKVFINQFLAMDRAKSLQEFQQAYSSVQGIPWVNTMATDRDGNVWYADASATPNHSAAALDRWRRIVQNDSPPASPLNPLIATLAGAGLIAFDGSDPANEWVEAPGARDPGLVPFAGVPQLSRRDFVFNANDSHWLANPAAPLTGFSPLQGLSRVPQSLRTRMNLTLLTEQKSGGASGADGNFTLDELKGAILSNRSMSEELVRADVVQRCKARPTGGEARTDMSAACKVLESWDGRFDADSKGAVLWREFSVALSRSEPTRAGTFFAVDFNPDQPITTPNTLTPAPASGPDPVLTALETAVARLQQGGKAPDVALKDAQYHLRGTTRFGLHGGLGRDGVANVVTYRKSKTSADPTTPQGPILDAVSGLTTDGYVVNYGTSFLMAMEFTDAGPHAEAFLTYGENEDPASPFYSDQLQLFTQKQWRPIRYTDADIAADPARTEKTVTGG